MVVDLIVEPANEDLSLRRWQAEDVCTIHGQDDGGGFLSDSRRLAAGSEDTPQSPQREIRDVGRGRVVLSARFLAEESLSTFVGTTIVLRLTRMNYCLDSRAELR